MKDLIEESVETARSNGRKVERKSAGERSFQFHFTDPEKLSLGTDLAKEQGALTEIEEKKKDVNDQFKADISAREAKISSLTRKLNNGYEYREVACENIFDFREGTVTMVRTDTAEIVDERGMKDHEKQMPLSAG